MIFLYPLLMFIIIFALVMSAVIWEYSIGYIALWRLW